MSCQILLLSSTNFEMDEQGIDVCWTDATDHAGLSDALWLNALEMFSGFCREFGQGLVIDVIGDDLAPFGFHVLNLTLLAANEAFVLDSNFNSLFFKSRQRLRKTVMDSLLRMTLYRVG